MQDQVTQQGCRGGSGGCTLTTQVLLVRTIEHIPRAKRKVRSWGTLLGRVATGREIGDKSRERVLNEVVCVLIHLFGGIIHRIWVLVASWYPPNLCDVYPGSLAPLRHCATRFLRYYTAWHYFSGANGFRNECRTWEGTVLWRVHMKVTFQGWVSCYMRGAAQYLYRSFCTFLH